MSEGKPAATVRLRDLAGQVSRRWMLVAASIALATGASLGASTFVEKEYTAVASLAVSPLTTNPFSSAAVNQQINIITERAILESSEVARIASKELGVGAVAPHILLKQVDVAAPSGSQVLEVSVTAPDPQDAADYANAMAAAYLQFRAEGAADVASGYVKSLDREIARLTAIKNPTAQQGQQLSDAVQQRQNFILVADSPGRIIGVASAPAEPSSLSQRTFLIAGLAGGLLVGIVAALLRERLDTRVRRCSRLSEACSAPALKVADRDDAEGMRWVLRSVTAAPAASASGPLIISTMPVAGKGRSPRDFVDGLAGVARAAGLAVLVLRPADIDPAMIDQGWPGTAPEIWSQTDLVILESDHRLKGARRARLADHLDAAVVLATAKSSLKDLKRLHSDLGESKARQVPVLLGKRFDDGGTQDPAKGSLITLPTPTTADEEVTERKEPA
ncbi:YveK family protein [Arthrobacter globiformis]|uniref:YveK family protein n=1 Tax=Arthrobacter globiformis TaxID=1665 RepID=UPI000B415B79|nr:Wzz/FepE/Etk N-terminal domain-containing protein [Arthrobacter globiformis]